MSEYAIEGRMVSLKAFREGDGYIPFVCATSMSFRADDELIEVTDANAGRYRKYKSRRIDWGFTLNTITHIAYSSDAYTVFDTLLEALRTQGLDIEMSFVDDLGNIKTLAGHVLIPHTGISVQADNFSEDDVEFQGSGTFTIGTTLLNPGAGSDMDTTELYGDGVNSYVQDSELIDATIEQVSRAGYWYDIITTGTPTAAQVKWTASTGRFDFSSVLDSGEKVVVFYRP